MTAATAENGGLGRRVMAIIATTGEGSPDPASAHRSMGPTGQADRLANEQSLVDGSRLLSAYQLADGTKLWAITEAADDRRQREATTFLLPSEY